MVESNSFDNCGQLMAIVQRVNVDVFNYAVLTFAETAAHSSNSWVVGWQSVAYLYLNVVGNSLEKLWYAFWRIVLDTRGVDDVHWTKAIDVCIAIEHKVDFHLKVFVLCKRHSWRAVWLAIIRVFLRLIQHLWIDPGF